MRLKVVIFPLILIVLFFIGVSVGSQINAKKAKTTTVCNRTTHKCKEAQYGKRD